MPPRAHEASQSDTQRLKIKRVVDYARSRAQHFGLHTLGRTSHLGDVLQSTLTGTALRRNPLSLEVQ